MVWLMRLISVSFLAMFAPIELQKMPKLKDVNLTKTQVTDDAIKELQKAKPDLTVTKFKN